MVDSQDWVAIYDERLEKQIKTDWKTKEELENALKNLLVNNTKPRAYYDRQGNVNLDYSHGERLREHIGYIADKIWRSRGVKFLGTIANRSFKARFNFGKQVFMVNYNKGTDKFSFMKAGRVVSRPNRFFIGKRRISG